MFKKLLFISLVVFSVVISTIVFAFYSNAYSKDITHSITYQQRQRSFIVHLPSGYKIGQHLPMVMVFHGGAGNAESMMQMTKMNRTADKYGFIAVYPNGISKFKDKFRTWNAGSCCGLAKDLNIDDVGFISKMIDFMVQKYSVNPKKVYSTGHSNGAMISYRLACDLSHKITAIAPNGGQLVANSCSQSKPIPVLHIHGKADKCAPYNGAQEFGGCFSKALGVRTNDTWSCDPVPFSINKIAARNKCDLSSKVNSYKKGSFSCLTYNKCSHGAKVTLCSHPGGHVWPGGEVGFKMCNFRPQSSICQKWISTIGPLYNEVSSNELMWGFFSKY